MVRCWYMDKCDSDQRLPHMTDPSKFLDIAGVKDKTGVYYHKINTEALDSCSILNQLKNDHGYTYEDEVKITTAMPEYEKKIKMFYEEHLHSDEEIRLILDGTGYFDVRGDQDEWIRIELEKGDLIVLPAGIYHRFTTDTQNFIHAKRYFVGEPVWTPHNRPAEDNPERKSYIAARAKGQTAYLCQDL